jgi:DNA-binding SARP family transcriptional activator/basic membrane lipoprotein Med (substrate-binding protein (PBP1-ABC) superfamily)
VEFQVLGPLQAGRDGRPLPLGGRQQRAVLATLVLQANRIVSADALVDALWGERPPESAVNTVQGYVSRLRKLIATEDVVIAHTPPGYVLRIDPDRVDAKRFERFLEEAAEARLEGSLERAAELLRQALALWQGPALAGVELGSSARLEVERLEVLRLTALEERIELDLALGRHGQVVAELETLVAEHPLRERLREELMLALYRSGRQADALETYQRGRRLFADELGLEPGETLRRLETQILQQDPELDRPSVSPHSAETGGRPPPRRRRLVVRAVALTLLGIAAIVGLLTATTIGHGQRRPRAASLRVALVHDGPRNLTETSATADGVRAASEDLGVRTKILYGGYALSGFLRKIAAAAQTSDFVIVDATPNLEAVSKLTRRFPRTRFLVPDSVADKAASFAGQQNVTGVKFADREDGYLGGYLAGLMTHGDEAVSAVGGTPTQVVRDLIGGFRAGARHARPRIRVLVDYAGTFVIQNRCEAAANRQINRGSAVVFDVAGGCGFGALQAAGIRGVWGLGVDSDLSYLGPQILGSVVKRVDRATQLAVTLFARGQLPGGQDLRFDLASDSIGLVGINDRVPAAVRAKVEKVAEKLRAHDQARDAR